MATTGGKTSTKKTTKARRGKRGDTFAAWQRVLSRSRKVMVPASNGNRLTSSRTSARGGYGELLIDENGNPVIHTTDGEGHHTFFYSDGTIVSFTTSVS